MDMLGLTALLLFITEGVLGKVQVDPWNATVLQHSEARFNCSVSEPGWVVMIWSLNKLLALTILESSDVFNSSTRFSARNYSTEGGSKWEFIIGNVLREDSGQVTCQIQGGEPVAAELSVQESGTVGIVGANRTATEGEHVAFQCLATGWFPAPHLSWTLNGTPVATEMFNSTWVEAGGLVNSSSFLGITAGSSSVSVGCLATVPALSTPLSSRVFLTIVKADEPQTRDQTVLIAVTVSFSAAALLVLIIIAIVWCCKRRKQAKSSYQKEASREHSRSQRDKNTHTGEGQGCDNLGYVTEGPKANVSNNELMDSGCWQKSHGNSSQMPDFVKTSQEVCRPTTAIHTISGNGVRTHRHVTIV